MLTFHRYTSVDAIKRALREWYGARCSEVLYTHIEPPLREDVEVQDKNLRCRHRTAE